MEWFSDNGYRVTDDPAAVNRDLVHRWLSEDSYWALGRSRDIVDRSIEGSLPFSLFDAEGAQVGFCRMVTDSATFAWLADVYVDRSQRGHGSGRFLVRTAIEHPVVIGIRQVLGTADAHTLYEKFGYQRFGPEQMARFMIRQPS